MCQVGIGAFVLNDANEVLVVQEKSGGLKGKVSNIIHKQLFMHM